MSWKTKVINSISTATLVFIGSCAVQVQTFKIKKSCVEKAEVTQKEEVQNKVTIEEAVKDSLKNAVLKAVEKSM